MGIPIILRANVSDCLNYYDKKTLLNNQSTAIKKELYPTCLSIYLHNMYWIAAIKVSSWMNPQSSIS